MKFSIKERQKICKLLNSLEVVDSGLGYVTVEYSEENLSKLEEVGVTLDITSLYGNEEDDLDITALAFGENYADLYGNDGFIKCDDYVSFGLENELEVVMFRVEDEVKVGTFKGEEFTALTLTMSDMYSIYNLINESMQLSIEDDSNLVDFE